MELCDYYGVKGLPPREGPAMIKSTLTFKGCSGVFTSELLMSFRTLFLKVFIVETSRTPTTYKKHYVYWHLFRHSGKQAVLNSN